MFFNGLSLGVLVVSQYLVHIWNGILLNLPLVPIISAQEKQYN